MHNTEQFWQWFTNHNEQLIMLGDMSEQQRTDLEKTLQEELTAYCDGLSYEMGDPTPNGRRLTFSAEGDTELFSHVVDLVDTAPDLDWWEFVAFRQAVETPVIVRFGPYSFNTSQMHFMQLECEEEPDILGLRIAMADPKPDDEDQLVGLYTTIETIIGEFDCATLVGYMEACPLPAEPFQEGFRPLNDLPQFVEWFKQQRDADA